MKIGTFEEDYAVVPSVDRFLLPSSPEQGEEVAEIASAMLAFANEDIQGTVDVYVGSLPVALAVYTVLLGVNFDWSIVYYDNRVRDFIAIDTVDIHVITY